MGTERVDVEAVWKIKDGGASGELAKLSQNAGSAASSLDKVKTGLGSLASAVGIGAGVAGIGSFVKSIVQVNQSLESTRFSMGSVLWAAHKMGLEGASGLRDFQGALSAGAETTKALEEHAAKAIGTTEDYVESWRAVSLPILQAGGNMANVLEVSKLLVPTAKQFGIGMETAGFSIKQALMGMVDSRDMMVQMLGLDAKQMNELAKTDKAAALEKIVSAMRNNSEAMAAAGGLFESQTASIEDAWLQLKRQIGAPLFEELKKKMEELLSWVEKNQEKIKETAKEWGEGIRKAFLVAVQVSKWVADHWGTITTIIKTLAEVWIGSKLIGSMRTLITLAETWGAKMAAGGAGGFGGGMAGGGAKGGMQSLAMGGVTAFSAHAITNMFENIALLKAEYASQEAMQQDEKAAQGKWALKNVQKWEDALPVGARALAQEKAYDQLLAQRKDITGKEIGVIMKSADYQKDIAEQLMIQYNVLLAMGRGFYTSRMAMEGGFGPLTGSGTNALFGTKFDPKDALKDAPRASIHVGKVEIKVDARHQDPDRVATSVVNAFARAALMPTRPKTSPPFGM